MTVQVRLATPDRLPEILSLPVDTVGIGQEGCITKLPDAGALRETAARIRSTGRTVDLIIPAAWPRTESAVQALLEETTAEGPTTVCVNDLGTLIAWLERSPDDCTVIAGLGLTRALPHAGNSDEQQSAGGAAASLATASLLRSLSELGVHGADVDSTIAWDAMADLAPTFLKRRVLGAPPVAWGRSCPTARHHDSSPPQCRSLGT